MFDLYVNRKVNFGYVYKYCRSVDLGHVRFCFSTFFFCHLSYRSTLVYCGKMKNLCGKLCPFCVTCRSRTGVFSLSSGRHPAAHVISVGHPLLLHAHDAGSGQPGTHRTLWSVVLWGKIELFSEFLCLLVY